MVLVQSSRSEPRCVGAFACQLRCPKLRSDAPWEARTPDLEVSSLTLWPAELRKLLQQVDRLWF